jgi:cytochrome c2
MKKTILVLLSIALCATAFGFAESMADDGGKALFEEKCAMCHAIENSTDIRMTKEGWKEVVFRMKEDNGCPMTDDEANTIVKYLTKNYGKK